MYDFLMYIAPMKIEYLKVLKNNEYRMDLNPSSIFIRMYNLDSSLIKYSFKKIN